MHHWRLLSFVMPSGPSQSSSYICCVLLARTCWSSWSIIATPPRHQKSAHSKTKFSARWHLTICKRKSFDLEYFRTYQKDPIHKLRDTKLPRQNTKSKNIPTVQLLLGKLFLQTSYIRAWLPGPYLARSLRQPGPRICTSGSSWEEFSKFNMDIFNDE